MKLLIIIFVFMVNDTIVKDSVNYKGQKIETIEVKAKDTLDKLDELIEKLEKHKREKEGTSILIKKKTFNKF